MCSALGFTCNVSIGRMVAARGSGPGHRCPASLLGKGGKRLNPSLWRLLLAGLGKRRERAAEGWGKRDRAPGGRQGPQRVSVSPRRDCGLQFKILA
ncbi:unnamed protein product [Rangifer tarandus platyrhynchus]|uniref:Uncharacterized protein n=2 Tax=Rangifer tarandus platyrhynchus TaxID=3082113 RepID=A0ACB0E1D1_RANTA|nr:unnamed protein product [Rangifer tarandus platyrhynchus]CAI9694131.1 unnamed protein product [Rangifer tarandus platyrhynchus]